MNLKWNAIMVLTILTGCGSSSGDSAMCIAATDAISAEANGSSCTALIRLSTIDLSILGWSLDCGPKVATTADQARSAIEPLLNVPSGSFALIGEPTIPSEYLFWAPPLDLGGLAAVSKETGHPIFVGTLEHSSLGTIRYPADFRPASGTPASCSTRQLQKTVGINPNETGGQAIDAARLSMVTNVVGRMAIIPGLERSLQIKSVLVVNYAVDTALILESHPVARDEWLIFVSASAER